MPTWSIVQDSLGRERPEDTSDQEATLIAQAKTDRQAFALLYERYLDRVYRYCYRRVGSQEAAEDAASEVFFRALKSLPAYDGGSFTAWLLAIAHNVVVDQWRRQRPEEPLPSDYDQPDESPTPEEIAVAEETDRSVRALLARLPVDQRSVLELRLAGLTGAEIATALGRSLGSVKMLQFRAMASLRVRLGVQVVAEEGSDGDI